MAPSAPPPPQNPSWHLDVPHGRILVFAPHPDDEIAGPGGCLALHRRANDMVRVIVVSSGTAGDPDARFDAATYAELRRSESRAGLRELGVDDAVYWGLPDNCVLSEQDLELGRQLAANAIAEFRPDVIYLPWEREGHPDHHALYLIVLAAMQRVQFAGRSTWLRSVERDGARCRGRHHEHRRRAPCRARSDTDRAPAAPRPCRA
jgi:LmbE family N-acetylglucosaminyl deacetylase